jgi:hypothetical protein
MTAKRVASAHRRNPLEDGVRKHDRELVERADRIMAARNATESDPRQKWTVDEVLGVALRIGLDSMERAQKQEPAHA